MKLLGWGLILLGGGGLLYLWIDFLVKLLADYYAGGELGMALAGGLIASVIAEIPIGIGILLVARHRDTSTRIPAS